MKKIAVINLTVILLLIPIMGLSCGSNGDNGNRDIGEVEATASIGPEGGMVEVVDPQSPLNGLQIDIPEGATSSDIVVTISSIEKDDMPFQSQSSESLGICFDVGPDGATFEKDVTIRFPYQDNDDDGIVDNTSIPEGSILLLSANAPYEQWNVVESQIDEVNNELHGTVRHFTRFNPFTWKWPNNSTITYEIDNLPTVTDDTQDAIKDAIGSAFDAWEEELTKAGIHFEEAEPSTTADISLFWTSELVNAIGDAGPTWDLGHWKIRFSDNLEVCCGGGKWSASLDSNDYQLNTAYIKAVAMHEIGHVVGLQHPTPAEKTQYPDASSAVMQMNDGGYMNRETLGTFDVYKIRQHYDIGTPTVTLPEGYVWFHNNEYRYKIGYPESWPVIPNEENIYTNAEDMVFFKHPEFPFGNKIVVGVYPDPGVTIEELEAEWGATAVIVNGREAYEILTKVGLEPEFYKKQLVVPANNKLYIIYIDLIPNYSDEYEPVFNNMAKTFVIE